MTTNDQPHTIPAGLTRDQAQAVREWAERSYAAEVQDETMYHAARVLLAVLPPRPTLADMTTEERAECQWMQADTETRGRVVIVNPCPNGGRAGLLSRRGNAVYEGHTRITPRPDLPRMEWPGDKKVEDVTPVKVGDVIESADDPRLDALPVGTVLVDCNGETVAKRSEEWAGLGYIPIESEGDEFGPWTVRRIGWEADQ